MEIQMENYKKQSFIEKYGKINIIIAALCVIFLVINSVIGSLSYLLVYHVIAVVNAIIMCLIFPNSISVGASAGIFGMIGTLFIMKWKKDPVCNENLKKGEYIYIIVFSILSLLLGLESFVTRFVAFVFGLVVGLLIKV